MAYRLQCLGDAVAVVIVYCLVATGPSSLCRAESSNTDCSQALNNLHLSPSRLPYFMGTEHGICRDQHRCCSGEGHEKILLDHAKAFAHNSVRRQFRHLHNLTRTLSQRLDNAVCHSLASSRFHKLHGDAFARHEAMHAEFYCWIETMYTDCSRCEQQFEQGAEDFFKYLQITLFMAKENILDLEPRFMDCAHGIVNIKTDEELNSTFSRMVTSLQRSVCNTCVLKKALKSAARLLHTVQGQQLPAHCVRHVACMQSCSCCSNDLAACVVKPCRDCCHNAMTSCTAHLAPIQGLLLDLDTKLHNHLSFMQHSNSPDSNFQRIGGLIGDFIKHSDDAHKGQGHKRQKKRIETKCGRTFQEAALSMKALAPTPAGCLTCPPHTAALDSSVDAILAEMERDLPPAINTTQHIPYGACHRVSTHDKRCDQCLACHAETMNHEEMETIMARQKGAILKLQHELPELYVARATATVLPEFAVGSAGGTACDDEDAECVSLSGDGESGSADLSPEEMPGTAGPVEVIFTADVVNSTIPAEGVGIKGVTPTPASRASLPLLSNILGTVSILCCLAVSLP